MNLTYLSTVKTYLGITATTSDTILTRLISSLSNMALSYIQRPAIVRATYNEYQNGVGNQRMMLRNWPVISVSNVQISNASLSGGSMFGTSGQLSPPSTIPAASSGVSIYGQVWGY